MKKSRNGKCPICGGVQKEGETTFSVDLGFGVIVVRNVPALVCEVCGEDFIEDNVAEVLEKIVEQARKRQRTVEIVQYNKEIEYSLAI